MRRTLIVLALAAVLSGCGGDETYKTESGSATLLDGSPAPKDAVPFARISPREQGAPQTFLRWTGRGWRTVARRRVLGSKDALLSQAVWR